MGLAALGLLSQMFSLFALPEVLGRFWEGFGKVLRADAKITTRAAGQNKRLKCPVQRSAAPNLRTNKLACLYGAGKDSLRQM
jgi:hypothetical protein